MPPPPPAHHFLDKNAIIALVDVSLELCALVGDTDVVGTVDQGLELFSDVLENLHFLIFWQIAQRLQHPTVLICLPLRHLAHFGWWRVHSWMVHFPHWFYLRGFWLRHCFWGSFNKMLHFFLPFCYCPRIF